MSSVDLYGTAYGNFDTQVLEQVRRETYGEDLGQSSWITADEYRKFSDLIELVATDHVLDVGCGSGGPALFLARERGCRVTGIDISESGIQAALNGARRMGLAEKVDFRRADVGEPLPFDDETFDVIVCMDAICHMPDRHRLFAEWRRILRARGRILFTDPVVVTGLVTNEELAIRSSTGYFEFCPPGVNERLLGEIGIELRRSLDVTENAIEVSRRWHAAREKRSPELVRLEGDATFAGLQRFLSIVNKLANERRLSRISYLGRRPGGGPRSE